jgi:preprotein translocase subunit SecE
VQKIREIVVYLRPFQKNLSRLNKTDKDMAGIKTYFEESYNELVNKVTWPTWSELQESTVLVFIGIAILTVLIFLMDFIFGVVGSDDSMWKGLVGFAYQILA